MSITPEYILVYGTLRPAFVNPFANYLRQYGQYVGEGIFPGDLYDLGNYPGATYQPDSLTPVYGAVYDIHRNYESILTRLDEYEGVGDAFEQPNEYIRTVIPVRYADQVVDCWVYVYNWPTDHCLRITSGDYVLYKRATTDTCNE
ncbi:gamma-glutamylcyclotransferase family protein [Spirosoma fluminis]